MYSMGGINSRGKFVMTSKGIRFEGTHELYLRCNDSRLCYWEERLQVNAHSGQL